MTHVFKRSLSFALSAGLLSFAAASAFAQNPIVSNVYTFSPTNAQGENSDGILPAGHLVQGADGNFYGVTQQGGLIQQGGNPILGPTTGCGTIFKITPGGVLTTLHYFGQSVNNTVPDGVSPTCLILGKDGSLYGACMFGGYSPNPSTANTGSGTFWKITPSGAFSVIYTFPSTASSDYQKIGGFPVRISQAEDGNFYGTDSAGINANGLYKITPSGTLTPLHTFGNPNYYGVNADGLNPSAPISFSDGNLYGVTSIGGANNTGTIYRLSPNGAFATIHTFAALSLGNPNGTNIGGANPVMLFLGPAGNLYGITRQGGNNGQSSGAGTLFVANYATGAISTIYNFGSVVSNSISRDGYTPDNAFYGTDGYFYVSSNGGVAKISTAGVFTSLGVDWGNAINESLFQGVIEGSNGYLYNFGYSNNSNGGNINQIATNLPTAPLVASLYPPSIHPVGVGTLTIRINGQNFLPNSQVYFNGTALTTHYRYAQSIGADVPASLLSTVGNYPVTVVTPAPGGGTSNTTVFVVNAR